MGIAVVLLQDRSTEVVAEDEPAAVSIQNFVEIPIGDDSTETAVALEPDVTPELGAGAVDANDQELASATVVTPDISQIFHPPLELEPEYDRLKLTIKRGDTLDRLFRRRRAGCRDAPLRGQWRQRRHIRLQHRAGHRRRRAQGLLAGPGLRCRSRSRLLCTCAGEPDLPLVDMGRRPQWHPAQSRAAHHPAGAGMVLTDLVCRV